MKAAPLLIALLIAAAAHAAEPAALRQSRQALDAGIPQVAIQKLRAFLTESNLPGDQRRTAILILGEALLEAQRSDEALNALRPLLTVGDNDARLLEAHVFASSGRWEAAFAAYKKLPAGKLGESEALQALGRTAEAIAALELYVNSNPANTTARLRLASLNVEGNNLKRSHELLATIKPATPGEEKWKRYAEGRILLAEDHPAPALVAFEEVLREPEGLSENLVAVATLGVAEARIILNGYDVADRGIETFIWHNSDSPFLELIFRRLDQIYARQENPNESELRKMGQKGTPRIAALARFYAASMQIRRKKFDLAAVTLASFEETYPEHELLPSAQMMQADLFVRKSDYPSAVRELEAAMRFAKSDEQRAEIEFRTGRVHYEQREFLLAANLFHSAATRSARLRENATFNAALAQLGQRNYDRFLEDYRELTNRFPDSSLRGDLILEQGLTQARTADSRAADTLQLFLLHFPLHTRTAEARLAMAELALNANDNAAASKYLRVVNDSPATPATEDNAAYLAIFIEDAKQPRNEAKVLELGQHFLREHATSTLLPEVRMKLGQIFFRRDDFSNAETQFATLARESPQSPYAETALFLAGESAMRQMNPGAVDRALALFDDVAARNGALKLRARQQQAAVQSRLGKEAAAIALYDLILGAQPPPEPALRFAALCAKGDNLLTLGRREEQEKRDEKSSRDALSAFDQLAAMPGVTPEWRNQALYKKAKALEQLGRTADAIAAYYDVLDPGSGAEREYFWYYKAGFDAARTLEQQTKWKDAIGIYDTMGASEGPRAAEAKTRAKQLRLAKFIWE